MADTRIEALTNGGTAIATDRLPATRDPSGTPSNVYLSAASIHALATGAVNVAAAATGGIGTQGSPWTGWDTAITWTEFTTYRFKSGWYAYDDSPNYMLPGIQLIGEAGTHLQHTGSGNAFVMDAGSTEGADWVQNLRVENIIVHGNVAAGTGTAVATAASADVVGTGTAFLTEFAVGDSITFNAGASTVETKIVSVITDNTHLTVSTNFAASKSGAFKICKTTNAYYIRGARNGIFKHLSATDYTSAGFYTEACVTNILENFRVTSHEPETFTYWQTRPRYGIVTSGRGADWSTTWTIINPVIEYLWGIGIWFKSDSYGNTVINGTSEGNVEAAIGIQVDGTYHSFINTDAESNGTGADVAVFGSYNQFINFFSQDTFTLHGSHNVIQGGHLQNLVLTQAIGACFYNVLLNPKVLGTLTEGGNDTMYLGSAGASRLAKLGVVLNVRAAITISGGNVASDWATADLYQGFITDNFTFSNPSNLNITGQIVRYYLLGAGSYTIAYAGKWAAKNGIVLPRNIVNGQSIILECIYNVSGDLVEVFNCTHGLMTVAQLPSASANPGARSMVSDANATTFLSTVAGGGANKVPVISDGTNWVIG